MTFSEDQSMMTFYRAQVGYTIDDQLSYNYWSYIKAKGNHPLKGYIIVSFVVFNKIMIMI